MYGLTSRLDNAWMHMSAMSLDYLQKEIIKKFVMQEVKDARIETLEWARRKNLFEIIKRIKDIKES